ncbi:MAG TPA: hypothetical protein VGK82_02665 [Pyrinomonadaceae bacterium]
MNLILARSLTAEEGLAVELKLGVLERGNKIKVESMSGKLLGVISPYGIRSGEEAGTYTVPVPPELVSNKRLSLRIVVDQYSRGKRAPTKQELRDVRLQITPRR